MSAFPRAWSIASLLGFSGRPLRWVIVAGWQRVGAEGGVVYAIGARTAYTKPFFPGFWIKRFFLAVLARRGFSFVGAGNLLFYRCDGFPSPAAVAAAAKQTWARRFL